MSGREMLSRSFTAHARNFDINVKVLHYREILILVLGWLHLGEIFFMLRLGGLHVKHAMQLGILGTTSAFAIGPRKSTDKLDRVGRSQDLLDPN
jgi:hypothetical protein